MAAHTRKLFGFHVLVVIVLVCGLGDADRVKKKIYVKFNGIGACFRRFNSTHQTGCTSSRSGNVGVVHVINSTADREWLLTNGSHQPYVAVIPSTSFDRSMVRSLIDSGKVNGIIVMDYNLSTADIPNKFSPDLTCPNDKYGMYQDHPEYADCKALQWNSDGNGLLFEDFNIPIYSMTNRSEVDFLIDRCYIRFNKPSLEGVQQDFPLCAAELKDVMDGAKDTITCMRRSTHITNFNPDKYCDPLGDRNVISTFKHVNKTQTRPEKSVIVVAARLDATSMFTHATPGADSAVSGFVALLGAAEALSKVKDDIIASDKDIMFAFFQGETYDYIGSSRMVYEMGENRFPQKLPDNWDGVAEINASHILHYIEVNQIGLLDAGSLYIHTDPVSLRNTDISAEVTGLIDLLQKSAQESGVTLSRADKTQPLPPASFQSFLKHYNMSGLVLTDHKKAYTNTYYNSRFDTARNVDADYPRGMPPRTAETFVTQEAERLTKVSTTLAKTLYRLATGNATADVSAQEEFVANLLYCYLHSPKCNIFRTVVDTKNKKALEEAKAPYQLYVGVDFVKNVVTKLTLHVLSWLTGDILVNATKDSCKTPEFNHSYSYIWMQGPLQSSGRRSPMCVRSLANYSDAVSPAFVINGYDMLSGEYSTWTESIWPEDAMSVRIFVVPSQQQQTTILAVGVIVFLLLTLLIYFIARCPETLFSSRTLERL